MASVGFYPAEQQLTATKKPRTIYSPSNLFGGSNVHHRRFRPDEPECCKVKEKP